MAAFFQAFNKRFRFPAEESESPSQLFYSFDMAGGVHCIHAAYSQTADQRAAGLQYDLGGGGGSRCQALAKWEPSQLSFKGTWQVQIVLQHR